MKNSIVESNRRGASLAGVEDSKSGLDYHESTKNTEKNLINFVKYRKCPLPDKFDV